MAGLGALCLVLPGRIAYGENELRWPTLAEVLDATEKPDSLGGLGDLGSLGSLGSLDIPETPETPDIPETIETPPIPASPVIPDTSANTDSRIFLRHFYASLAEAGERKVRVLHYGDSQIEEDRMTMQIREALQKRYGGQGVGLMPLAQTIPTRTIRQELRMNGRFTAPQQGPKRYLVYGPKRDQRADGLFGIMGQVAVMNDSIVTGSETITAVCKPQTASAHYEQWKIFADSSVHYTTSGDTVHLQGRGAVYAISQESRTGVIVDNIPMRGCLGLVFNKIDSAQIASFCREEHVELIIMQFGGNAIPTNKNPGTIKGIVSGLREQVRYVRSCAPEASILFIGPSDMLTQEDGEWKTYPMVPYMDRLLRKMTMEEGVAYFSLYQWMGGSGSMKRWQEYGLAGSDGVHFYRSGARKAGNAVADWILEGMENGEWRMENGEL